MNWQPIESRWHQLKAKAKQQWSKLTDEQLDAIAGKRDQLSSKIQQQYGLSKEEAERQLNEFENRYRNFDQPQH